MKQVVNLRCKFATCEGLCPLDPLKQVYKNMEKKQRRKNHTNRKFNYTLRLNEDENNRLRNLERETGLRRSQLMRKLLNEKQIVILRLEQQDRPLLSNLHRIGQNLNQALKIAHETNGRLYWVQDVINSLKTLMEKYQLK